QKGLMLSQRVVRDHDFHLKAVVTTIITTEARGVEISQINYLELAVNLAKKGQTVEKSVLHGNLSIPLEQEPLKKIEIQDRHYSGIKSLQIWGLAWTSLDHRGSWRVPSA
ncbi:hypothetical protein C5167_022364, partial [Papaver somniferum]